MKKILLVIVSLFFFVACASKKKIVITEKVAVEKTEKKAVEKTAVFKSDSTVFVSVTKAIEDAFFVSLEVNEPKTDSIINQKFKSFKNTKISGNNNYSVSYDPVKKGIQITANIEASSSSDVKVVKQAKEEIKEKVATTEKVTKEVTKNIKKTGLSFWHWLLFFLMILAVIIYLIYRNYDSFKEKISLFKMYP